MIAVLKITAKEDLLLRVKLRLIVKETDDREESGTARKAPQAKRHQAPQSEPFVSLREGQIARQTFVGKNLFAFDCYCRFFPVSL